MKKIILPVTADSLISKRGKETTNVKEIETKTWYLLIIDVLYLCWLFLKVLTDTLCRLKIVQFYNYNCNSFLLYK